MKGRYFDIKAPNYNSRNLFLVEGQDDAMLLDILLEELGASEGEASIVVCGGKEGIGRHLPLLVKSSTFRFKVNSVSILRDADTDANTAIKEVHKHLKKQNLPLPLAAEVITSGGKRFGLYLFPKAGQCGDLETLALELAPQSVALTNAHRYIEEVAGVSAGLSKLSKRKVQTYLAGHSAEIRPTVGWAFKDRTIPVSNQLVPELSSFLKLALGT